MENEVDSGQKIIIEDTLDFGALADSAKIREPQNGSRKKEKEEEKQLQIIDVLKIFSPGTGLRSAVDDILRAEMGALIAIENEKIYDIIEGGFRINCKFTPQRLTELAKMDGAIIISKDLKKVLYANTLLVPDVSISTKETGTRHKAAERAAKQTNTIVVAVSERKNKITLYYGDIKYEISSGSEVLRRATETLQILEKQKEIFNDLLNNLNVLEITSSVTIYDVCSVLQRAEMVKRVATMVKRYLIELGKEGIIVSMRLKELTKNLNKEVEMILRDYFNSKHTRALTILSGMSFDFLLEISNLSRMLFDETHDKTISPKGYRILSRTNLLDKSSRSLITNFKTLDKILNASDEELLKVLKKQGFVDLFKQELESIKDKIMTGKTI
ncbi:MAG: DNA integrity scanning diadenylate cyclase DisA [Nanoarchaeota archaeon]